MKGFGLWITVAVLFLTSCVSESAQEKEKEKGLPGSWLLLDSSTTGGIKRVEFLCFGENGSYDAFLLASKDTIAMDKVTGMRRIRGSWTQKEDTLKISGTEMGLLGDSNGIGYDWPQKMEMKPGIHHGSFRYRLQVDSLFISGVNLEYPFANRQSPNKLINKACPY